MTDRINILGVGFDSLTMDEAVSRGMAGEGRVIVSLRKSAGSKAIGAERMPASGPIAMPTRAARAYRRGRIRPPRGRW